MPHPHALWMSDGVRWAALARRHTLPSVRAAGRTALGPSALGRWTLSLLLSLTVAVAAPGAAQDPAPARRDPPPSPDSVWRVIPPTPTSGAQANLTFGPATISRADLFRLSQRLTIAPVDTGAGARQRGLEFWLPRPAALGPPRRRGASGAAGAADVDLYYVRFLVHESTALAPALAAGLPKSYRGRGADDPTVTTRFDLTADGVRGVIFTPSGTFPIEPVPRAGRFGTGVHASDEGGDGGRLKRRPDGVTGPPRVPPRPGRPDSAQGAAAPSAASSPQAGAAVAGRPAPRRGAAVGGARVATTHAVTADPTADGPAPVRTVRLVAVATAEYTALYARGAPDTAAARNAALVAINRTVRYVNEIMARDLGVVLTVVPASRSLIFVGADPPRFERPRAAAPGQPPPDYGEALLNASQAVVDSLLPAGTLYDVAHVFGVRGTSWAAVGALCDTARKARGVSLIPLPEDSAAAPPASLTEEEELYFATDVVAHEIGHQLGATHTFNTVADVCAAHRWEPSAFEPGSGSTVMAYPGLCPPDIVQSHAGPYYHAASIQQVRDTLAARGASCGVPGLSDNRPPRVAAASRRVLVPRATPFRLAARGADPDGDALRYTWEEYAPAAWAPAASPPLGDEDGHVRPLFRSFPPEDVPTRTLPGLSALASGQAPYETLPSGALVPPAPAGARTLTFRVTARDWRGGLAFDDVAVDIVPTAGPFRVTAPAAGARWPAGSQQVVTWQAARTTAAPLHCANVRVTLAREREGPYDVELAASVPNRAEKVAVRVPRMSAAADARVQVACVNGAFFALSPGDVRVVPAGAPAGRPARPRAVRKAP